MEAVHIAAVRVLYKSFVRNTLKKLAKKTDNNIDDYMIRVIDLALGVKKD